jgi:hypothetical protein|tara:strand:+ start:675 stop:1031 length:357 start_codon:yes stop_codon:yes gene_type:complete
MGCKDDDTCDQPATKGEIENLVNLISIGFSAVFALVWINNSKISRVKSHTSEIHEYGTIGAPNQGAMRDKKAIRELLEESPRSRKRAIQFQNAIEWDRLKQHKKKWVRPSEDKNPYRD